MAGNLPPQAAAEAGRTDASARHYVPAPPTPRELRAQAVHRLQVGLFGLCAMLLIVGLANIIMDRARLALGEPVEDVVAVDTKPTRQASDPLSDLGVLPAADPTPDPASTDASAASPAAPPR